MERQGNIIFREEKGLVEKKKALIIIDMLNEIYDGIKDVLEIDIDKWYLWYYDINWSLKVDEAVEVLFDWIPERLIFSDLYFQSF